MKRSLLLTLVLMSLAGCKPKYYSELSGSNVLPTGDRTKPAVQYAVPVYKPYPDHAYTVFGCIRLSDGLGKWEESDTIKAARMAKAKGADALIICSGAEMSGLASAAAGPSIFPPGETGALVIRWKPQTAIDESAHRLEGFRAYLRRSYPRLALDGKDDLWKIGIEYVTWSGVEIDSDAGNSKLENALSSVVVVSPDLPVSKWLFKGRLLPNVDAAVPAENLIYGIATITHEGDQMSIACSSPGMSMEFTGHLQDEYLSGQMKVALGATAYSGGAAGEFGSEKIQLKGRGKNGGNAIPWTFVFLR